MFRFDPAVSSAVRGEPVPPPKGAADEGPLDGPALQQNRAQLQVESELLDAITP